MEKEKRKGREKENILIMINGITKWNCGFIESAKVDLKHKI